MILVSNWNDHVSDDVKKAALKGLKIAGEVALEESNRLVPHDTGMLHITKGALIEDEKNLTVTISYNTPYAVRLHENPQYNFRNGRQGKWLEKALQNNEQQLRQIVADAIKEAMK
jgi:hypothetical protein